MLLILTGDVEIGKTTWLTNAVDSLTEAGGRCDGVLAPGIWERKSDGTLDKLGIDNLLLPTRERVPFARRADLALAEGVFDESSQSAKAQLKWHISDDAIMKVNAHFDMLMQQNAAKETRVDNDGSDDKKRLLVVDELGQLELLRDEGLTSAVSMLEKGPCGIYEHAVLIARDRFGLVEEAERRFSGAWSGSARISPTDESRNRWIEPMMRAKR